MLITWTAVKDHDGLGNTAWVGHPREPERASFSAREYRILGVLRDDRAFYSIEESDPSIPADISRICPSLDAAQAACDEVEARLTGHIVTVREAILDTLAKTPARTFIDPEILKRVVPRFRPDEIEAQVTAWAAEGKLRKWFAIKGPGGSLGHGTGLRADREFWPDLDRIPNILYDTGDERFRRDDGEIVEVYRRPDRKSILAEGHGL